MPLGSLIHVMMPLLIGLGEAFRLYPNDCQSAFKVTDVQAIIHSGHMRDEMKQGRLSASVWPIANVSMLKVLVDFMNDNGQIIEDILQWVWDHVSALSHDERVLLLSAACVLRIELFIISFDALEQRSWSVSKSSTFLLGQQITPRPTLDAEALVFMHPTQHPHIRCLKCRRGFPNDLRLLQHPGCGHLVHQECADYFLQRHGTCQYCRQIGISEIEGSFRLESSSVPGRCHSVFYRHDFVHGTVSRVCSAMEHDIFVTPVA
ncbi:hypothetical protein PBRA_007856 [Plasmodiophora brassicae]|uniref:C2H2-type domain-containing protein n=1 Tax=Plasmodiophora brassicae TaxID=37360 RepID=A0A0G4IY32_PLABS|nr:secrectory protein [Plasmodiophora brassicae]CEP00122.1 hypothetical protein PBRA_007856 [Plasmodiophora brassicae]